MADRDVQQQTEAWLRAMRDRVSERQQPALEQQRTITRSQAQEQQHERSLSR